MADRPLFTFTEEQRRKFSTDKLLEGVVLPSQNNPPKGDDDEGQPL